MKVLILEDVIEHQVRLERILDEISKALFPRYRYSWD